MLCGEIKSVHGVVVQVFVAQTELSAGRVDLHQNVDDDSTTSPKTLLKSKKWKVGK